MKQDEFKVVGIKHSKSKDGSDTTTLYLETVFDDYTLSNKDNVCDGLVTASEYFFSNIKVNLGDVIEVLYRKNTFTGKAMASGIVVITPAKK